MNYKITMRRNDESGATRTATVFACERGAAMDAAQKANPEYRALSAVELGERTPVVYEGNMAFAQFIGIIEEACCNDECPRCGHARGAHGAISTTCPDGKGLFQ